MADRGRPLARAAQLVGGVSVALAVAGCSGDESAELSPAQESGEQTSSAPSTVEGESVSLSVASFTLPDPGPWVSGGVNGDATGDITGYKITDEESGVEVCTVVLRVISEGDITLDSIRENTTVLSGDRATFEDDAAVADGVAGLISRVDRSEDTPNPFISVHRSWITPGDTYVSLVVTARGEEPDPRCDPELIVSTLQWNGQERPVAEVSS